MAAVFDGHLMLNDGTTCSSADHGGSELLYRTSCSEGWPPVWWRLLPCNTVDTIHTFIFGGLQGSQSLMLPRFQAQLLEASDVCVLVTLHLQHGHGTVLYAITVLYVRSRSRATRDQMENLLGLDSNIYANKVPGAAEATPSRLAHDGAREPPIFKQRVCWARRKQRIQGSR